MKAPVITCATPHIQRILKSWDAKEPLPEPGETITLFVPPSEKLGYANAEVTFDRQRDDGSTDYRLTMINPVDLA